VSEFEKFIVKTISVTGGGSEATVEVFNSGPCGGDGGHGARALIKIHFHNETGQGGIAKGQRDGDKYRYDWYKLDQIEKLALLFAGDWEIELAENIFRTIADELAKQREDGGPTNVMVKQPYRKLFD